MTGWHQVAVCLVALISAALTVLPLELQRRLINDAIEGDSLRWLAILGGIYAVVLVVQALIKLGLRLYQAWLSESAVRYTREHLSALLRERHDAVEADDRGGAGRGDGDDGGEGDGDGAKDDGSGGEAVSVIEREVDRLGGFVGEGPSDLFSTVGMLVAILGYMVMVEPMVALACAPFLLPQLILIPLIQRHLNRLTKHRLHLLRESADSIAESATVEELTPGFDRIFTNRIGLQAWKFSMKSLVNILNAAAPLAVLIFGGMMVINGETSLGVIVAFMTGFERLSNPLRELLTLYRQTAQARVQHDMVARWM